MSSGECRVTCGDPERRTTLAAMDEIEILTDAQTAAFRRDGFAFAPGFYDRAKMATITAWIEEVAAWPEAPGRHMVYHENSLSTPGQRLVQRIEDVTPFHAGLNSPLTKSAPSDSLTPRPEGGFADGEGTAEGSSGGSDGELVGDAALAGSCVLRPPAVGADRGRL